MFKNENIHPAVQKALYRKIDALNRLQLGTNDDFFRSNALEPQDNSNPIEQHLYRNCFAKVSAAIKSETQDELLDQPESLSSYFTIGENRTTQTNKPLTFRKSFEESADNIFRGHTGITGIEASQLSFFTKKYTINFSCPDPIDFESRVQPTFLRHGQFIAIEFGWGIEEDSINIPPLSNKDLADLVDGVRERNLQAAGNYICDVGIVTNYNFELNSTGGYTGTIDVVTQGQNILNQTTQETTTSSSETISTIISDLQEIAKNEAKDFDDNKKTKDTKQFSEDEEQKAKKQLDELKVKSVTYQSAMRNLDKVLDEYLGEKFARYKTKFDPDATRKAKAEGETGFVSKNKKVLTSGNPDYKVKEIEKYNYFDKYRNDDSVEVNYENKSAGTVEYIFRNGAMYLNMNKKGTRFGGAPIPDSLKKRYFVSWGWFEDHILNSFFRTKSKTKDGGERIIQELRSISSVVVTKDNKETTEVDETVTEEIHSNRCHISEFLFSLGLDSVILPNKHQIKIKQDFPKDKPNLIKEYTLKEKIKLARIRNIYEIIDENFNDFVPTQFETDEQRVISEALGGGIIRNMVFPIEMLQKHFQNISTVRQGMQSFWADVSNQYGNFWNFKVAEDDNVKGRVGVSESLLKSVEEQDPSLLENQSDRTTFKDYTFKRGDIDKKYKKMFTFPLYSKDGIIKEFSLDVKLTSKAAVLVNYGTNTNILNSVGGGDQKDLGVIAYTYLLKKDREKALKVDTDTADPVNKSDAVLKDLSYEISANNGVGVGTDLKTYKSEIRKLNSEFGIDFKAIKDIQNDQDEILNKIQSERAIKEDGLGIYDENGNLTPIIKTHMNYIINYSLHEGDDSNIQRTKPVIPIELSMTLDGIGGLKPGDMFRVDYLPKVYRDFAYFQIFQVNHSMGTSGWETKITAQMKLDLPKMIKEGYVQTSDKRQFNLDTITEAMEAFRSKPLGDAPKPPSNFTNDGKNLERVLSQREQLDLQYKNGEIGFLRYAITLNTIQDQYLGAALLDATAEKDK